MLAAATLLATTVLASTLFVTPVAAQQGQQQGQGSVTIDEILESPRQYYGQRVTITGEVGDILGSRSFVVLAGAMAPGVETMVPGAESTAVGEIPVVGARPLVGPDGRALGPSDLMERVVRVTGTVHQFNVRAFEDRLGIDLPDTSLAGFAGRPAIIASQVVPVLSEQASSVQRNGADGTRTGAAGQPARAQPSQGGQQQEGDVTIADILDNPRQYVGRRVTITGSLGQVLGPRSFAMMDGDLVFGDDVAVVARQPITDQSGRRVDLSQWAGREVQVTGTVHQFNLAAFEDQLGVDLDDAAWADYRGGPAIIATSVTPVMASQQGQQQGQAQQGQAQQGVRVDAILDRPSAYYGRQVTVDGDVDVLGPGAIRVIGEDPLAPESLLVISRDQAATRNLTDGNNVRVTGTIRQFYLVDVEQELGYDWDDTLFVEFEGRPALIARSITRIEGELGRLDAPDINVPDIDAPNIRVPDVDVPDVDVPDVDRNARQAGATVDAILDSPRQYYRQRVTVTGAMGGVLGPRSFTLTDDDLLSGEEIPVVTARQITDATGRPVDLSRWTVGDLRVTGTVHQFNLAAFEDQLGMDLDDGAWASFAGRPAIIASSVTRVDNQGQRAQPNDAGSTRPGASQQADRPRG